MKKYVPMIGFIAVLIPVVLLALSVVGNWFEMPLLTFVTHWPLLWRVIFYNTVFFVLPVVGIICGTSSWKRNVMLNRTSVAMGVIVLMWYGVHLVYD